MELYIIKSVSKKQAKAYAIIALDILSTAPNDLDVKLLWTEIDVAMRLYSPSEATIKAENILENNKTKWKKLSRTSIL